MLQQTRVEAVIPYWVRWMKSFPTVQDLAQATEEQVNAHWAGLGFYRRARLLHQACQELVKKAGTANNDDDDNENDDLMPRTSKDLMELPGIGRYTACAIASIAYGEKVAVVDGNVCRVLSRLRGIANQIKATALKDKHGWELAQQLIEAGDGSRPGDLNQALMELGATYCAPSGTGTDKGDPLTGFYRSNRLGFEYATRRRDGEGHLILPRKTACPICASDGIERALERMDGLWEARTATEKPRKISNFKTMAQQWGHAVLPLAPPKPTRKEEVLAVAVLSDKNNSSYLMVKRPPTGLLVSFVEKLFSDPGTIFYRLTPSI